MKLIIHQDRIAATASDDYAGPDAWLPEPDGFDILLLEHYRVIDGALTLPFDPALAFAKREREAAVAAIQVTTAAGHTFEGDETSQTRIARAITVLTATGGEVPWVLADNSVAMVGAAELTEALALAGAEQARLWVFPYEPSQGAA